MAMTLEEKIIQLLEQFIPDERNQLHVLAIIQEFINQERKKIREQTLNDVKLALWNGATRDEVHRRIEELKEKEQIL